MPIYAFVVFGIFGGVNINTQKKAKENCFSNYSLNQRLIPLQTIVKTVKTCFLDLQFLECKLN